jgi:hypothetical protein
MIKTSLIVVSLLLAGAFLNSKHSPTNRVCDRVVDRCVELVQSTQHTAVGLASDVQKEVNKKN